MIKCNYFNIFVAEYMVVLFADFENDDGYDCLGYKCYSKFKTGKFPEAESIWYCGVCGEVNKLHFTKENSKVLFLGTV